MSTERFNKLYISLKFRLKGAGMYQALHALELAREIHSGFRKDGVTPEFQHQLEIALYIFTLKDITDLEGAIIVALLHDTDEDYPHKVSSGFYEYGTNCAVAIRLLNKHTHQSTQDYFDALGNHSLASLVKGVDRINNFQSMNRGKFSLEKQQKYADEVVTYFLPMLKYARKRFPQQMDAYYNVENMLKCQHELITLFLEAAKSP